MQWPPAAHCTPAPLPLFLLARLSLTSPWCRRYDMTCRHLLSLHRSVTYKPTVHISPTHPCLLAFFGRPLPESRGASPVEDCMFCLWSVTSTSTVGPNWMWALSEGIRAMCTCVCVCLLVDWWGDTSTDGGFSFDECHWWTSSCPLGSASRQTRPLPPEPTQAARRPHHSPLLSPCPRVHVSHTRFSSARKLKQYFEDWNGLKLWWRSRRLGYIHQTVTKEMIKLQPSNLENNVCII